jgi:hypothetical protein
MATMPTRNPLSPPTTPANAQSANSAIIPGNPMHPRRSSDGRRSCTCRTLRARLQAPESGALASTATGIRNASRPRRDWLHTAGLGLPEPNAGLTGHRSGTRQNALNRCRLAFTRPPGPRPAGYPRRTSGGSSAGSSLASGVRLCGRDTCRSQTRGPPHSTLPLPDPSPTATARGPRP